MEIVPGATHLFEERGTLEQVARLAADWFQNHLRSANVAQKADQAQHPDRGSPFQFGGKKDDGEHEKR